MLLKLPSVAGMQTRRAASLLRPACLRPLLKIYIHRNIRRVQ